MLMATTQGIEVGVLSSYEYEQSQPDKFQFIWSYQISIVNNSNRTIQLQKRHWFIYDSLLGKREVVGDGVIGQQPILAPSDSYQYVSWCPLHSEIGMMKGFFKMIDLTSEDVFDVVIPDFTLCAPYRCN